MEKNVRTIKKKWKVVGFGMKCTKQEIFMGDLNIVYF